MTFNTGNPIGSTDARDLSDNAENFDKALGTLSPTWKDRLGVTRDSFEGRLANGSFYRVGTFSEGYTLTNMRQTLEYDGNEYSWAGTFPKVVAAGSTPETSGGIGAGAWVDRTDVTLRSELSGGGGAALIGAGDTTQEALNANDVRRFGAQVAPFDSTAAFVAAYAAGNCAFVPAGGWITTVFHPDRTYGEGRVFSTFAADGLYQDSGERPISKSFQRDSEFVEYCSTFGNFERASGKSLVVNNDSGRAQVSGYASDSEMATYVNADHVGYYIGMHGPKGQVTTADATTTFTATTLTAPEITQANVDSGKIKVGMFVKTKHAPRYSGRVLSIDVGTATLTMSGWWAEGNTASGQVPPNGTGAVINAADKIWGQNTNVFITSDSTAKTATGYELGLHTEGTVGVPVWGHHVVNLTNAKYLDIGYNLTGFWAVGINFDKDTQIGVKHSEPITSALRVENLTNSSWAGSALELSTNYPTSAGSLIKISKGAELVFKMDSNGHRSSQRESATVVTTNATLTPTAQSIVLCVNTSAIALSSSGTFGAGHVFEIKAAGTANVTFAGVTLTASGGYGRFVYDGTGWIRLI